MRPREVVLAGAACLAALACGQDLRWAYTYDGPAPFGNQDRCWDVACGPGGLIAAAGMSRDADSTYDFVVAGLSSEGQERWFYRHSSAIPLCSDDARSLMFGPDGNLYVAGKVTNDMGRAQDIAVVCLDTAGEARWQYCYDRWYASDVGWNIAVAPDGSVYVAGTTHAYHDEFAAICLTHEGGLRWVYVDSQYTGRALAVAAGLDGRAWVAGYIVDTAARFRVVAIGPDGSRRWDYRHRPPGASTRRAEARAVARRHDNAVWVTGYSMTDSTNMDVFLVCLDSLGAMRCSARYDGPAHANDEGLAVVCDSQGGVYVAGYCSPPDAAQDLLVLAYDSLANLRWVYSHDGALRFDDAKDLTLGPDGTLYAAGESYTGSSSIADFIVVKLDTAGNEQWLSLYNGPGGRADEAWGVTSDTAGNVYAGGFAWGTGGNFDFAVASFSPVSGMSGRTSGLGRFTGPTIARGVLYTAGGDSPTLRATRVQPPPVLLDASGRRVTDLVPGRNDIRHLAPGVYFVREHTTGSRQPLGRDASRVTKVVLVR